MSQPCHRPMPKGHCGGHRASLHLGLASHQPAPHHGSLQPCHCQCQEGTAEATRYPCASAQHLTNLHLTMDPSKSLCNWCLRNAKEGSCWCSDFSCHLRWDNYCCKGGWGSSLMLQCFPPTFLHFVLCHSSGRVCKSLSILLVMVHQDPFHQDICGKMQSKC